MNKTVRSLVFVALLLSWLANAVFSDGQPELEIALPPAFLEDRGEEWTDEFRSELLRVLAATPVANEAVHLVLRFATVPGLPFDPEEAAAQLTEAIEAADARLRRGLAPGVVSAEARQRMELGGRATDALQLAGAARSFAETPLERVERIFQDVQDISGPASIPNYITDNQEIDGQLAPPGNTFVETPDDGRPGG